MGYSIESCSACDGRQALGEQLQKGAGVSTLIEAFLSCVAKGDVEAALGYVASDVEFVAGTPNPPPPLDQICGTYNGHDGVREFFRRFAAILSPLHFHIDHAGCLGDVEVAFGMLRHHVRRTGRVFESQWTIKVNVRNGFISRYYFMDDTYSLFISMQISRVIAI